MEKAGLELAEDQIIEPAESPPLQNAPAPWLVIPYGEHKEHQAFYNISEPNNTSYRKSIPELKGKSIWQKNSHQGWCILLCDDIEFDYTPLSYGDCFLWNPIAPTETIMLPSLLYWYNTLDGYCLSDCVLSSPPLKSNSSSTQDDGWNGNPTVFMFFTRKGEKMYFPHSYKAGKEILLFCHVGEKEWTTHEFPEQGWPERLGSELGQSICYCKSKLYIIGPYILLEIEIKNESEPKTILSISEIQVGYEFKDNRPDYFVGRNFSFACMTRHYVESSDEMFMITKYFIPRGVYEYCVTIMFILKLDFSSMSWVEVTSMDDHVLFISRTTRLCCSAKELGFARGWVYFTQPDEMSFYKYDFEDKTVMLSLPCPDLPNPWFSPNWLMIPTPLWNDDHRGRGTESMLGNNRYGGNNTKIIQISSLAISLIRNSTDDDMKENFEEARPWGMLIEDILWFISSYLSPLDYTHLRAVCRNYRSVFPIMDWRKFCYPRTLQTNVSSPWMVFPKHNGSVFSFINPVHNDENYLTSIPELLKGLTIRCSKGGWLLMSDEIYRMFFCNPFTKEVIHLPKFMVDPRFRGISFSSLPTSSDCVVFAVGDESDSPLHITCIKRGQDKWMDEFYPTSNMNFDLSLNSPIFYNGAFYCLDLNGTLGAFSLENGMSWEVFSMVPPPDCGFIYKSYLVELEGKLLSILLGHYGRWVRVFRLDMSEMVWVEVEHLGRHVLFISNTSCMGRIAPTSQMENKIYFPRLQNQGILYYSLDSGTYHSLGSEHYGTDYCNSKDNLRCSWIEPNWSETLPPNFVW